MNYVFMTDASCDLTQELVNQIGVEVLPMEFHMEDKSYLHYPDCRMMSLSEFYSKLKEGHMNFIRQHMIKAQCDKLFIIHIYAPFWEYIEINKLC